MNLEDDEERAREETGLEVGTTITREVAKAEWRRGSKPRYGGDGIFLVNEEI